MRVYIACDKKAQGFKDFIVEEVKKLGFEYEDLTEDQFDAVDASDAVCTRLLEDYDKDSVGIVLDRYGVASYVACNKHKNIVASSISDERSALMTKRHNGARILIMGSGIVGEELAKTCLKNFLSYKYDGGRHQIRVDMLNKML